MDLVAVGMVLISAFFHSTRDFLTKKGSDKQVFVWWYRLVGMVLFLPVFLYTSGPNLPSEGWFYIIASAIVHVFYWYTLAEAYQEGDLSLVYPIARSAPIFVVIWAGFVWQETMTLPGVFGVLVVVFGAYILQMQGITWTHLKAPIIATATNRSIRMAWVTALLVAAYSLIDDRGVSIVDPIVYLYVYYSIGVMIYFPYVLLTRRGKILAEWQGQRTSIILAGVLGLLGYLLALYALRMEKVSYVTAVRQSSVVFGVVMGSLLLKESHGRIRLFASVVMFVGIVIIVVFG